MQWLPERGVGWFPVVANPYGQEYFEKYDGYAKTEIGERLNAARLALVARHWSGAVVDIGIGCGQFVASRPDTAGFDVNPAGVKWLKQRGLFRDPYRDFVQAATFFDSLEHIADPSVLLANVGECVFVSLPIFRDVDHMLGSRHFRKDEHFWYFTQAGFIGFMNSLGWMCVELNDDETKAGREDILSFAFRRHLWECS